MPRQAVPFVLLTFGLAAIALALIANDVTWKAVWIGVASTLLAAGLVDTSALFESRRRERAILDIAGERVGRVHQRLLSILTTIFEAQVEAKDLSSSLRGIEKWAYDANAMAPQITPPRTKADYVQQCLAEMDEALAAALNLGALTGEAARFVQLDEALRSGPFVIWLRNAWNYSIDNAEMLARQAADVLDPVQEQFSFFADRNRPGWRYGQLPAPEPEVAVNRTSRERFHRWWWRS